MLLFLSPRYIPGLLIRLKSHILTDSILSCKDPVPVLPIHHTFECTCNFIMPLYKGGAIAHCEGLRYITKNIQEIHPTFLLAVPAIFEALHKAIWKGIKAKGKEKTVRKLIKVSNAAKKIGIDLTDVFFKEIKQTLGGKMRMMICGGAAINPEILEDLQTFGIMALQGYGLSEALAAVTLCADEINKSGSVGIPIAGNYIKIIDPATRKSLPFGEVGEIVIHNNALMMGYLNDESETNDALQMHDDGYVWLHTGDLGRMDEDGYIFYEGRQKRMIITSGYNVYPSHIESVIESHPAVLQCSVVGVPHPYKQEVPKAFIVLKEGYHGLFVKSEIKDYCKKNLAKYAVPYEFVYRKSLPKTKIGKVDFQKLKEDNDADDDEE